MFLSPPLPNSFRNAPMFPWSVFAVTMPPIDNIRPLRPFGFSKIRMPLPGPFCAVEDESAAAADISHRLRHGCASAILRPDGAGLVYFDREFRYLTALAIPADKRHQGIGRELCRLLSRGTQSTILVCCSRENIGFYEKCGFSLCSEAAYCAVP